MSGSSVGPVEGNVSPAGFREQETPPSGVFPQGSREGTGSGRTSPALVRKVFLDAADSTPDRQMDGLPGDLYKRRVVFADTHG